MEKTIKNFRGFRNTTRTVPYGSPIVKPCKCAFHSDGCKHKDCPSFSSFRSWSTTEQRRMPSEIMPVIDAVRFGPTCSVFGDLPVEFVTVAPN